MPNLKPQIPQISQPWTVVGNLQVVLVELCRKVTLAVPVAPVASMLPTN
jgi:hypothetical protein